jgi:DNA-binding transcriptional MerR regulator
MRIGELAERAGTTTRALRYDESRGLLTARRTRNGHRSYDEEDLLQLRQIRTLQEYGFGLEETRPFVECLRAGHPEGDSCPDARAVYRAKLAELDAVIERLGAARERVRTRLARAEEAAAPDAGTAPGPPEGAGEGWDSGPAGSPLLPSGAECPRPRCWFGGGAA